MKQIIVYINSAVADTVSNIPYSELSELFKLAEVEHVKVVFNSDYCRVIGRCSRKVKVPQKAINTVEGFIKWTEEKIKSAWK